MKYNTLVVAPVFTRSGYGEYAREVVSYLLDDGRFDVRVAPTRWGDTPMNAVKTPVEERIVAEGRILKSLDRQPDLQFEITIPTEFGRLIPMRGKKLIGMTAGIEANICPPDWIEGVNRTDLTFATSEFAKRSLLAEYKLQSGGVLKVTKPVEVAGMGADPALWRDAKRVPELQYRLDAIREDFAFLFVGHWLPGSIGEDRKDVGRLISLFCQAFAGNSRVALILKTSTGTHSKTDQIEVAKRVASIRSQVADAPSVYLVHGDLTDREMSTLFRHIKVKAFISLTHGEGLMISGLQFSLSGKPLILPGYSGHLDYLFPGHPTMKVEMTPVPPSGLPPGMIGAGAVWGTVPDRTAVEAMRAVFMDFPRAHALGQAQKSHVERTWTREAVRGRFIATLNHHLREVPFEEEIDLPVTSHTQEEVS